MSLRSSRSLLLLCALGAAVPLRAAELVTLRTGFAVRCTAREEIAPGTVRLHLDAADNFLDVSTASIAAIETAPDPAPAVASTAPRKADSTAEILAASGAQHNVNIALLASVVQAESAGNPHAISRTGARGLMQLMPGTASELGVKDSFAPADNVDGGSTYLSQLLTRYHEDLSLALAAYNAGPAAVDRYHGIPPYRETRAYVARVILEFNRRVLATSQTTAHTSGAGFTHP